MKILHINGAKGLGGGEFRTIELVKGLISRGHQIYVLCRKNTLLEKELDKNEINYISYHLSLISFFKILKFLNDWEPQIIHIHTGREYFIGIFLGILFDIPVVIHRRLMSPLKWSTKIIVNLWKTKIIAVSKIVKDTLIKVNKFKENRIEIVYNAVLPQRFIIDKQKVEKLKKEYKSGDKKIIISVGHLYPTKGHSQLIKVADLIRKKLENFVVLVVGDGDIKERIKLENLISQLKLKNYVKLLGRRDDVIELLTIADCFVLLSYEDPFPGAFIEALHCGVPVIGYNIGGIPEIVSPEVGFLVPPFDICLVAEKIVELLTNETIRKQMALKAKEYSKEKFSFERMVNNVERIYFSLVSMSKHG
jgi:glycosyltransferase involved in cell wall biosynthesis